jgi:antitoxin component YwqK of YwqJK toxin-antitoxin module
MKPSFLLIIFCACHCLGSGQPLDSGRQERRIPDGKWMGWYMNGKPQFIRTYSVEKWRQFQNEKTRYHPKRISMPLTKLYHDNKELAEKYTNAINSFCALQNCARVNETIQDVIDNNAAQEHYHPPFENGLLHGLFINWFIDGSIKDSGYYQNGLPEGIWIKWTGDKQFYWKGFYRHGLKNKEWKLYSSNGFLIRILSYREGKLLWTKDVREGTELSETE